MRAEFCIRCYLHLCWEAASNHFSILLEYWSNWIENNMGLKGTFDDIIRHIHNDSLNCSTRCEACNISVASKEISNEMCECVYPGLVFFLSWLHQWSRKACLAFAPAVIHARSISCAFLSGAIFFWSFAAAVNIQTQQEVISRRLVVVVPPQKVITLFTVDLHTIFRVYFTHMWRQHR